MSLFDEPKPEEVAEEQQFRQTNQVTVLICAGVALFVVFFVFEGGKVGAVSSARTLGGTLGAMIIPSIVGWIASRFTPRWGIAFAIAFVISFSLAVTGKLYQRKVESSQRSFVSENQTKLRGNRQSKIYHWRGCPNFDDIGDRNRVEFVSAEEAKAAGYRPAQNCL